MEIALQSWRNSFICDIHAEQGSAHISSLCAWGESKFANLATTEILPAQAFTWGSDYACFKELCTQDTHVTDFTRELWIYEQLEHLIAEELLLA